MFRPWKFSVRLRLIIAALHFRKGRYSFHELAKSIIDSDLVRQNEIAAGAMKNDRFEVLSEAVRAVENLEGVIAEFGVFQGRTLRHLAQEAGPERKVYGFDSFEGLPDDWGQLLPAGAFSCTVPEFDEKNIHICQGTFDQTLPSFVRETKSIALIHIDCDLYESTMEALRATLPILQKGGVVVFDEYYGYPSYDDHEYKAWKELEDELGIDCRALAYSAHSCAFVILETLP